MSKTIYQNVDCKCCLFCLATLDFSNSLTEERNYCRDKVPNCSVEYHNFMRSLRKAKKSKSKLFLRFVEMIEVAILGGVSPKQIKPIFTFVNVNKNKSDLFKTKNS